MPRARMRARAPAPSRTELASACRAGISPARQGDSTGRRRTRAQGNRVSDPSRSEPGFTGRLTRPSGRALARRGGTPLSRAGALPGCRQQAVTGPGITIRHSRSSGRCRTLERTLRPIALHARQGNRVNDLTASKHGFMGSFARPSGRAAPAPPHGRALPRPPRDGRRPRARGRTPETGGIDASLDCPARAPEILAWAARML